MRIFLFVFIALIPPALFGLLTWQGRSPLQKAALHKPPKPPAADETLVGLFQGNLGGARLKEKVALYDDKGLFEYINGAAPIFLQRHFRKLGASELTVEGSDVVCDVYDMAAAENAQSIFAAERSANASPVQDWPQAIAGSMSFVFHHEKYYVKLTAFDAKAEAALPSIAQALKGRMK